MPDESKAGETSESTECVDSRGYQLKRTFAPLLVAITPTEQSYARRKGVGYHYLTPQKGYDFHDLSVPFDLAFYGVNDTDAPLEGELVVETVAFDGSSRTVRDRRAVSLPCRRKTAGGRT